MSIPDIPASGATPGPRGPTSLGKKLDSWGEIASYLGREVRTVQRWERTEGLPVHRDRKSTRLNSSHVRISYAVFCLKKKTAIPHASIDVLLAASRRQHDRLLPML